MGYLLYLCIVAIVAGFVVWRCVIIKRKPGPDALGRGSFVAEGWEKVEEVFRKQLKSGFLKAGAFSVYHRGRCVVNLTGGNADEDALMLWDDQTLTVCFSTTKGIAAVVMAMLVDRGLLDYKTPVSFYWPEFAQNGKRDITVEHLLSHQAGLLTVNDGDYSLYDMQTDPARWKKALESVKPYFEPGSTLGYHGISKGFYEDQLVRIVDREHRSMKQFFQEEVADVFGIDFYIGPPKELYYRLARNYPTSMRNAEVLSDPNTYRNYFVKKPPLFFKSFSLKEASTHAHWNNPHFLELCSPSSHGAGTAASLAKFYGILANGGVHEKKTLLSKKFIDQLGEPVVSGRDCVVEIDWTFGPGTMIRKSPAGTTMFGTPGSGGQNAYADPENRLGVAYLTNYLSHYAHDDPRFTQLLDVVYKTLKHM